MIDKLKAERTIEDEEFDLVYPSAIRILSGIHFTKVAVSKTATDFLCKKGKTRILDIGSGVGKFCLVGAALHTNCKFYGVERRTYFTNISTTIKDKYKLKNVEFINMNMLQVDFTAYDAFYFFNSFHEHIDHFCKIDDESHLSHVLYAQYLAYLQKQFSLLPTGTRLAVYYTPGFYIPKEYKLVESRFHGTLDLYIKTDDR